MTLSIIFSGASLILCGFFFIYFTLYIKRRTKRANILGDYQEEVGKLIADIDSATDRDLILVEERITALKKLLEDVDKRIVVLSHEQDRRRNSDMVYTSLGRQMKVTVREPPSGGAAEFAAASAVDLAAEPVDGGPDVRASPPEAPPSPASIEGNPAVPEVPRARESRASFAGRVAELSRAGFAPDLIAARLGVSLSEVELAIAVSRRKRSNADNG